MSKRVNVGDSSAKSSGKARLVEAIKYARAKWGRGFDLLSLEQQRAAVAVEFLATIAGQEAQPGSHASRIIEGAEAVFAAERF